MVLPILLFSSLFLSLSITCFLLLEVAASPPLPAQCMRKHQEHMTCSGQQREKLHSLRSLQVPWGWRVRLGLLRVYNLDKTLNLSWYRIGIRLLGTLKKELFRKPETDCNRYKLGLCQNSTPPTQTPWLEWTCALTHSTAALQRGAIN